MSRRHRRANTRKIRHAPAKTERLVNIEINGVLDLHHFKPGDVPELVQDYLRECRRRHIKEIRIIHGKGKGVLRAIVQDILARDPYVISYGAANDRSGWGATVAQLNLTSDIQKEKTGAGNEEQAKEPSSSPARNRSLLRWLWPWRHK